MQSPKKETDQKSFPQNYNKIANSERGDRCCVDKKSSTSTLNNSGRPGCSPFEAKKSANITNADLCCAIPLEKAKTRACPTIYGLMGRIRF